MADDPRQSPPDAPIPPPKLSPGFLLLWIMAICAFIGLAGCTLIILAFAFESGSAISVTLGLAVMLGALVWFVQSLRKARQAERAQLPPNKVLLYALLIPLLASFVWAGGCLLSVADL